MKKFRMIYYSVMGFLLFVGILTGYREFFFLFAVMLAVVIANAVLVYRTLYSFRYTQELAERETIKGKQTELKVGIYNDGMIPITGLEIYMNGIVSADVHKREASLGSRDSVHFEIPIDCRYRGVYRIGMERMMAADVFGLLLVPFDLHWLSYYKKPELIIYPYVAELPFLALETADAKRFGSNMPDGEELSELRAYERGDTAKRIHWKQSARQQKLLVRRYEQPFVTDIVVVLDTSAHSYQGEEKLTYEDKACEIAVSIVFYCLKSGHPVEFYDGYNNKREMTSMRQFQEFSRHLAEIEFEGEQNGAALPAVTELAGTVYLITSDPSKVHTKNKNTQIIMPVRHRQEQIYVKNKNVIACGFEDDITEVFGGLYE